MKLRLKDRPLLAGFLGGLMSFALILSMGAQPSVYTWARATFLIKGGPPVVADATARNIVGTTTTGQVPLNVQQRTGAGVDAFKVYSNGAYRLSVNSNGTTVCGGGFQMVYNAVTPTTTPGTSLPVTRGVVNVASAATASRHVYLPAASGCTPGQVFYIFDGAGTGATETITVNRNATPGTDTINGAASKTITTAYGGLMIVNLTSSAFIAITLAGA